MMSEPGPQPAPAPTEPAKKPPPVIPLPTVGEGKDQMDGFSHKLDCSGAGIGQVAMLTSLMMMLTAFVAGSN